MTGTAERPGAPASPTRRERIARGLVAGSLLALLAGLGGGLPARAASAAAASATSATATPPPAHFTDVTAAAGIDFVHHNGATGEKLLPETMGGGVAFLDFDRDGDQDLLFVDSGRWPEELIGSSAGSGAESGTGPARGPAPGDDRGPTGGVTLYANDGGGRFRDVTAETGLDRIFHGPGAVPFYGQGVAAGDVDGDGWIDLYLTAVGSNRLLRNRGGVFEDVTAATGTGGGDRWSTCAAFFDADGDGDLDLFVCDYLTWSAAKDRALDRTVPFTGDGRGLTYARPQSYPGAHPLLFRNDTGNGTVAFTEVARAAGLFVDSADGQPLSKALAVAPVDLDRDGRTDLLVTDDTVRNLFFHNLGPRDGIPRFEEVGELFGLAYDPDGRSTGAMGVDWGYLTGAAGGAGAGDAAGDLAILVGNFAHEHTSLYRAQSDPTFFADDSLRLGLGGATREPLTFSVLLFDYDLDGRLDLVQANGHVESDIDRIEPSLTHAQPPQLFWNTGGTPLLAQVAGEAAGDLDRPLVGRGAAYADIDGDGDLDLVLTQTGGPPVLLRNDLGPPDRRGRHWLRLRLAGRAPNRDAVGALVELTAGGRTQRRQVEPTRGYLSQVELPVTFGLGPDATVERLVVTWPDGARERFEVPAVDRLLVLERGHGTPAAEGADRDKPPVDAAGR